MDDTRFTSIDAEEEPVPQPAAAGTPPRKPPTTVGSREQDDEPELPQWSPDLSGMIRMVVGSLAQPLTESGLRPGTARALRQAGVNTVADLLRVSDRRMKRLGIDAATRRYIIEWRRGMRLPTTRR